MAWLPIETAPQDRIILIGYWRNGEWSLARTRWNANPIKPGWWSVGKWVRYDFEPTHWHEDVGTPARPPMFRRVAETG